MSKTALILVDLQNDFMPFGSLPVSGGDEVIEVARRAGIPGVVTHIKALGPNVWGESATIVQHIDEARAEDPWDALDRLLERGVARAPAGTGR